LTYYVTFRFVRHSKDIMQMPNNQRFTSLFLTYGVTRSGVTG
jgi:hypothetical protein